MFPQFSGRLRLHFICRRVWAEFTKDNLFTWAAAVGLLLAFCHFSVFHFPDRIDPPSAGTVHGRGDGRSTDLLRELPPEMSDVLWDNIRHFAETVLTQKTDPLILIGLLVAPWSASGGISNTMSALDRCYELEKGRPFWKHRLIALGLTIVVAVILLLVVGCSRWRRLPRDGSFAMGICPALRRGCWHSIRRDGLPR